MNEERIETSAEGEHAEHSVDLELDREAALEWLEALATAWGGDVRRIEGDEDQDHQTVSDAKLVLPVQAGLREGALLVNIATLALGDRTRTRLVFTVERSDYQLQRASLFILAAGLASAVMIVVLPLVTRLVGLLPVAFVFLILAWFLVLARVRYRGLGEFVTKLEADVAEHA